MAELAAETVLAAVACEIKLDAELQSVDQLKNIIIRTIDHISKTVQLNINILN